MRSTLAFALTLVSLVLMFGSARIAVCQREASPNAITVTLDVAVGRQYESTHVYITCEDLDRFVGGAAATFDGTTSK
jgi:hypothetical protein